MIRRSGEHALTKNMVNAFVPLDGKREKPLSC